MSTVATSSGADAAHEAARSSGPILVATNGERGAPALVTARRLAAHSSVPVIALSAAELPPPPMMGLEGGGPWLPDPGLYRAARRERVERQLRDALGGDVAWPVEVSLEEPSRAITDATRRHRASLVVMGIGRHDLAARLIGGEVTLRTVRRAPVSVLAVGSEPLHVPPRVAVAAVDFSPSSVSAARAALDLLGDGGTLHLVHVWARNPIDHPALVAHDDAYERALPGRFARVEAALLDRARGVAILPASLLGEPAEQVVAFARSHDADLIAAGRQGHRLIERLLIGRVTTGLLRGAPCAVLVTPEPSATEPSATEREAFERALTGTSESRSPAEWPELLEAFTRRNRGRRTALEVDAPEIGAQAQHSGYTLLGAAYDRHDRRVELLFGAAAADSPHVAHLTRAIARATSIAVQSDQGGRDIALRVLHDDGQTLLTFLPDAARAG